MPEGAAADVAASAEVLVVGAGPSGLMAAVELARHGVPARLVERAPVPHAEARATAVQPGTLELLAQAGIAERILGASAHVVCTRIFDQKLRQLSETPFYDLDCRWAFQCSLPQWQTEAILAARLAELGGAIERGVTVTGMSQRDDRVLVSLERAGGTRETTEVSWVIGAGGAHSVTRHSLAEELVGRTYRGTALAADVRVSCGLPRDGSALIATPAGYVLLAPLPGGRWITFVGDLDDDEIAMVGRDPSAGPVAAALARRCGGAVSLDDVGWASLFRMHRRLAPRLAGPRQFLVGDAGHLSSPFGGEGLNSGLHDAQNLGWKLALELRGRARSGLLASFASERLDAARHVLDTSDRLHALAHGAVESARTGVRPAPPSPQQASELARARAMLDVCYPASPLSGERVAAGVRVPAAPAPGDRYPDRVVLAGTRHHLLLLGAADGAGAERLRRRWHGLVEVSAAAGDPGRSGLPEPAGGPGGAPSGAVLVRPDGHIGFRAVPADAAGLDALDAHLAAYLRPRVG